MSFTCGDKQAYIDALVRELSERVGISMANLSNLKTEKVKAIRFSTLDAICRELQCRPGDILEYQDID